MTFSRFTWHAAMFAALRRVGSSGVRYRVTKCRCYDGCFMWNIEPVKDVTST